MGARKKLGVIYEGTFVEAYELAETLRKDYDCTLFERPKKFGKLLNNLEKNGFDGYVSVIEPERIFFFSDNKEKQD